MIPNAQRLNRGHYVVSQLVEACRANDVTDLVIVHEHRGIPGECICHFMSYLVVTYVYRTNSNVYCMFTTVTLRKLIMSSWYI